jgi:hypothetical protein
MLINLINIELLLDAQKKRGFANHDPFLLNSPGNIFSFQIRRQMILAAAAVISPR